MSDPTSIIILLLIGASFLFGYFKIKQKRERIIENGVEVEGIVFDFSDDNNISSNTNSMNISTPLIRFVTKDGLWVTEKGEWSTTSLKQGDKVIVIYNADNPKEFIYKTSMDWGNLLVYLFLVAGIVCLGISLWFAYKYLSS